MTTHTAEPWRRVTDPAEIPEGLDLPTLQGMPHEELSHLIRSQLRPRDQSAEGRNRWRTLWANLSTAPMVETTEGILEGFLEATESLLQDPDLPPETQKRARKFVGQCEEAWDRIETTGRQGPLAWAPRARTWPADARRAMAIMVSAVSSHRDAIAREGEEPTEADEALWSALRTIGLDPQDYPHRNDRGR